MVKLSAYRVYIIYSAASAFLFSLMCSVNMVYYIQSVHLNPLQLILVGTTLEAACFIFEIPTGVVADLYSRKWSVVIGIIMTGLGFLTEGSIPSFWAVLLSQVLWGVGYTFLSGADSAWIADEMNNEGLDGLFLRSGQIGQIASLIALGAGVYVGSFKINLPIVISGSLYLLLAVFLILYMPENSFKPVETDEHSIKKMVSGFKNGISSVKGKPYLITILFLSVFYGLYSEGYDRLWNDHFIKDIGFPAFPHLKPVVWFGIINATVSIFGILIMEVIKKHIERNKNTSRAYLLLSNNIAIVISIVIFGLSKNFPAAALAYFTSSVMRMTIDPIYNVWINRHTESSVRATVISMSGQLDALGQIIGGPIIGLIALKTSVSIGVSVSGLFLLPVVFLYAYAIRLEKNKI